MGPALFSSWGAGPTFLGIGRPRATREVTVRLPLRAAVTVVVLLAGSAIGGSTPGPQPALKLNDNGCFEGRGLDVLVFNNWYSGEFSDSKLSGVELIHHGVRTATNGDVRLSSTPSQWDPIPQLADRKTDKAGGRAHAELLYPAQGFGYRVEVEAHGGGALLIYVGNAANTLWQ